MPTLDCPEQRTGLEQMETENKGNKVWTAQLDKEYSC